jgi:IS30 family transposase
MIGQRPVDRASRLEAGHWEAGTAVSRQSKAALMVAVERNHRLYIVQKTGDKTVESTRGALVKCLGQFPEETRKSITYDNGPENAWHELTHQVLGTVSYFCEPCHSWEKGSIENRNGIPRRFYPKKTDWALTTQMEIDRITCRINSIPLKILDFKTPLEVFAVALSC